jgi:hypothetical protein
MSKDGKNKGSGNKEKNKQRMAGEVWQEYDAKGKGGEGFDGEDIRHLQKQGWSHNDIMRAAAASGDVRGGADQKLRKLNSQTMSARDLPESVLKDMRRSSGIAGLGGWNDADYVFLGGDRKDSSNYQVRSNNAAKGKSLEHDIIGNLGDDAMGKWNRKAARQRGGGKDGGSVLTWQGINADGSANAPTGTMTVKRENGKLGKMYKEKNVTWRLPPDFVATATTPATPATPAPVTPAPAAKPVTPFNLGSYATRTAPSVSSNSSGGGSFSGSGGFDISDFTPQPPAAPTAPAPTTPGSGMEQGYIGGFESKINKLYDRPADWTGDVWGEGSGTRFGASSRFRDELRERTGF